MCICGLVCELVCVLVWWNERYKSNEFVYWFTIITWNGRLADCARSINKHREQQLGKAPDESKILNHFKSEFDFQILRLRKHHSENFLERRVQKLFLNDYHSKIVKMPFAKKFSLRNSLSQSLWVDSIDWRNRNSFPRPDKFIPLDNLQWRIIASLRLNSFVVKTFNWSVHLLNG